MNLITDNIGTIVISLVIIGIVALIIRKMRKDKKSGGSCDRKKIIHLRELI